MDTPPWMTIDFFRKVLCSVKGQYNCELEKVQLTFLACSGHDEHVCQAMIRHRIRNKSDTMSLILKCIETADEPSFVPFSNEVLFYQKVLPELHRVLSLADHRSTLSPHFYGHLNVSSSTVQTIILEDLSGDGYETSARRLNFDEMKFVFKRLARFHAASWYVHNEERTHLSKYKTGIFHDGQDVQQSLVDQLEQFLDMIQSCAAFEVFDQRIADLPRLFSKMPAKLYGLSRQASQFKVLNHGNLSTRSVLFKRDGDGGELVGMKMLNFQSCVWASPALDLVYALYLIADLDTLLTKRDELVKVYHREFTAIVRSMGGLKAVPSLVQFNVDLLRNGFIELFVSIFVMPCQFAGSNDRDDNKKSKGACDKRDRHGIYENKEYQEFMQHQIKYFAFKGFLG